MREMLAQERLNRTNVIALAVIALCGLIAAFASVQLSGTKTGTVLSLVTTIGPALLYASLTAPLSFPFAVYMFLSPFDSVLNMDQFGTITRLLGAASAAALLFYMIRTKRAIEPPKATALWIVLLLWMAASMFWAIDVASAQALLPTMLQLFGLYVIVAMMPLKLPSLQRITVAVALGGIASALYGIYMDVTGAGIFKDRLFIHTDSSALNPDHFAASLVLPVAICLIAAVWTRSLFTRILSFTGLALLLVCIEMTGSRAAYLAVAVLFAYLIWRDPHRLSLLVGSVVLAVGAIVVTGPAYFFARWATAAQNGGAGRVSIWHTGLLAFKQNWLFGAGYGNFAFAYDRAFMQTFQPFYANWHRASHNILLGTAVELGVIGLVLLVAAWVGQFRLLENIPQADARYPLRLALEGALIGLFVCGMFADIMIWKYVWVAFMLVVLTRNTNPAPSAPITKGLDRHA